MTFGAANFGDAAFKAEYDGLFPLLDIKMQDPALSAISIISASLAKTENLGRRTIKLKPGDSTTSLSNMFGEYWNNLKLYFFPKPPSSPLVFDQRRLRLDVVCVEDFCTRASEIYTALKGKVG